MNTYLVADGGGTKTEFLMFDDHGNVLATARQRGSNALFIDAATAAEHVAAGIRDCMEQAGANGDSLHTALLFIPGFAPALPLLKARLGLPCVELLDDFWNAFYGALASPFGIVALAGTGSFVVGRAPGGEAVTAGGWGPLFGDPGSGYHLGVLFLRAAARLYNEGRSDTPLIRRLLRHMGIRSVPELRDAAYSPDFTREKVAELSYVAQEAAEEGDEIAAGLFEELADALAEEATVLAKRIGADGLPVSVTGGMTKAGPLFTGPFEQAIRRRLPNLQYVPARCSPLVGGALYLLAERQGADLSDGSLADRLNAGVNL